MDLKLPRSEFYASLELEELAVAKEFGIPPQEWDRLTVSEKERLIAAARDQADMERIAAMTEEERASLSAAAGWVRVRDAGR